MIPLHNVIICMVCALLHSLWSVVVCADGYLLFSESQDELRQVPHYESEW